MSKVNLDALIPREDFEVLKDNNLSAPKLTAIAISELEHGKFFLSVLRKPDFQRETNEWDADKVCDFILSFLNDDLIPSIILWNSGNRNFVIDGAHRLSALIAWVLDDYGDGVLSKSFFGFDVPAGQSTIAENTRKLIKRRIGTYKDHQIAIANQGQAAPEMLTRAQRLATLALELQWVKGNASKAEDSFFKINEEAAPINETEKTLLKSRNKPNAIAGRAIVRSGTGHKYWSDFPEDKRNEIEALAKEINKILFTPALETPLKTLDIPLAGKGYSADTLSLIFDLINVSNSIEKRGGRTKDVVFYKKTPTGDIDISDDHTGDGTIGLLKKTRKLLYRISNDHASSLGLHPIVYFYSNTGRYQVTSFLAIIELIKEFEMNDSFKEFTAIREAFENFLLTHKVFVNQLTLKHGSGLKGYKQLAKLYKVIIEQLKEGQTEDQILIYLSISADYNYLNPNAGPTEETKRQEFSTETKSAVFLRKALEHPIKCEICKGLIHPNSSNIDHKDRKQDGGLGNVGNGQLSHYYCNSTFKN